MNVLIKLFVFNGGAPFSMREYQRVLMNANHKSIVCGNMIAGQEQKNVFMSDTPCYHIDVCNERSPISIVKTALSMFRLMKNNKVQMLLSPSRNDFGACYAVCKATGAAFLPIIPGGSISSCAKNLLSVRKEQFICFSYENKDSLIENGIAEDNIHVISNRIQLKQDISWREHYAKKGVGEPLNLLLVSRLDHEHRTGILALMDRIAEYDGQLLLKVAGDGECAEELIGYAEAINKRKKVISFLGFIKEIEPILLEADIVIGKGRSVIMPVMMNRIGFVLGYDGGISVCNEENFNELYWSNFSGRKASNSLDDEQFLELCQRIRRDSDYVASFGRVFERMRKAYSTEELADKLMPIVKKLMKQNSTVKYGLFQKYKTVWYAFGVYLKWLCTMVYSKLKV